MTSTRKDTDTLAAELKAHLANENPDLDKLVKKFDISPYLDQDGDERYAVIIVLNEAPPLPENGLENFQEFFEKYIRPLEEIIKYFFWGQEVSYPYRTLYATERAQY